ncbi:hypothetical protein GQ53DRAFT_207634 [Thozetella sp. PMI_491]|nr:hypothetical protein GQ53DRAFT_207634 [Thozetella sp. PMI_491]
MGSSLPTEAHATCAGILVYSFACLFASLIVLWLVWVHNERKSYVALLAFFTSLSTLASIIQQIHTIIDWEGIKTEQHRYLSNNIGNPEIAIAGSSYGLDLVLFYIQFYSYNVESMLTMFWAAELAYSVFRVEANTPTFMGVRIKPGLVAKGAAILLPIIQVSLLRSRAVQRNTPAFLVLANMIMIFSLASGSLLLLVILVKYIYSRRALISWNVRYGRESRRTGASQLRSQDSSLAQVPHRSIYDRWLVVRFTIAFASLGY